MNNILEELTLTLNDIKAQNIAIFNTTTLTDQYDFMFIATATSTTHAKSITNHLVKKTRKLGQKILSVEGLASSWIVVDFGAIIIHIMLQETRQYYRLDELWNETNLHDSPYHKRTLDLTY